MHKTVYYFVIITLMVLSSACDNTNDFKDVNDALRLNKFNITSIEVEATRTKTVAVSTVPCDTQNPCNTFLPTNKTEPFIAYGFTPDNVKTDITAEVAWSTSDSAVAQITQGGSLTTQNSAAVVDVVATLGSVVGKTTVTVSSATLSANNIHFQNAGADINGTPTITACDTYPMTVLGVFDDGSTRNITHDVTWTVMDAGNTTTDAKVVLNDASNEGVFSSYAPVAPYTVKAVYKDDANPAGVENTQDITVDDATGTMSITPASLTVATNATGQLSALINNNNVSKDVTSTAKWATQDPSKVTVTNGAVIGVALGTDITITASCGSKSSTAKVSVANESVAAFLTLKDDANLVLGPNLYLTYNDPAKDTAHISVIVTYFDQSEADITADLPQPTIIADDGDTTLPTPVAVTFETSNDLIPVTRLKFKAQRSGGAMVTVNYLGVEFNQHVIVY